MGANGELQVSDSLKPGKNNGTVQTREEVGRRAGLDIFEKAKSLVLARKWFQPLNIKYDFLDYEYYCHVYRIVLQYGGQVAYWKEMKSPLEHKKHIKPHCPDPRSLIYTASFPQHYGLNQRSNTNFYETLLGFSINNFSM
jgi:hypothetical protein